MKFEHFIDLLAPVLANNAAEISEYVLRSTFDLLFDQNSNGSVEQDEFQSLLTLLRAFNLNEMKSERKMFLDEHLRQTFATRNNRIGFKGNIYINMQIEAESITISCFLEFSEFVKCGYVREILMG